MAVQIFKNFYGRDALVNAFNILLQFHTDVPLNCYQI